MFEIMTPMINIGELQLEGIFSQKNRRLENLAKYLARLGTFKFAILSSWVNLPLCGLLFFQFIFGLNLTFLTDIISQTIKN